MIEDSKFVKSIASNAPKKGQKVTWADGKTDIIFDQEWVALLNQALKENRLVHFTKDKNDAGYWNIQTLELAQLNKEPTKPPIIESSMPPKQEKPTEISPMTPDKWAEKDRITRKSIERQTSLNAAIELGKAMGVSPLTSSQIIATAKLFEAYLEGQEVVKKTRLVEEAKRLNEEA